MFTTGDTLIISHLTPWPFILLIFRILHDVILSYRHVAKIIPGVLWFDQLKVVIAFQFVALILFLPRPTWA